MMVDTSTVWTSPRFSFQDDPVDGNDDPSSHFSSFPDILEHQSSTKSRSGSPSGSRLDAISPRSVSPLGGDGRYAGSSGDGRTMNANKQMGSEFVHGFPGMPYGHGTRRESSSSTTIGRMGMNTRPYSPSSTGGDTGGRSTQRNSLDSKSGILSTPRFSRPNSPPALSLVRQFSSGPAPHPGLRTPYSDPLIPIPNAPSSTYSNNHLPHFQHNPHIGSSSIHQAQTHHQHHNPNFTSPHSSSRHSGEHSPTDDMIGVGRRGDDEVQPEVLDLVNVNEGVSDDDDDDYAGGNTFSNGALKEEPPTPRLSHAIHDPHNTAAYQEAQRLLNQVTKNLSSMSKSGTLGGNPNHSTASLMAELRRVGSGETSDMGRIPMSPLEDESGRAGNTNFLVEMAKMSTSMNGQPVHQSGHMHSLDPGQMDGIAVHDLQAMGIPQPPTPIGNFDFDDEDDEQDEEPLYVNAKQYHRILKRRAARARLEEMNRVVKERKPYLHESRHKHACSRPRGPGGRFLTAPEIAALKAKEEAEANVKPRTEVGPGGDSVSGTSPSEGDEAIDINDSALRPPTKPVGKGLPGNPGNGQIDMDWSWAG